MIEELPSGDSVGHRPVNPLDPKVPRAGAELGQDVGYAPHVVSDGLSLSFDDNQRFMAGSGIVQPLIGQAASGCPSPMRARTL